MKTICLLSFSLLSIAAFSQTPPQDTVVLVSSVAYYNFDQERTFFLQFDTLKTGNHYLICYYDRERKYRIFEGTQNEGTWFYLNGKVRHQSCYNPETKTRSIRSYYINGDLKVVMNEDHTVENWEYTPERKRILTSKSIRIPGARTDSMAYVSFDPATGDTTFTSNLNGCIKQFFRNGQPYQIEKKVQNSIVIEQINYPTDQERTLSLRFQKKTPGDMYPQTFIDSWTKGFDSLEYYTNLRQLYIHVTDSAMLEKVQSKLAVLPQLKKLRSVYLSGIFREIPPGVQNASQLTLLSLQGSQIRKIPRSIARLKNLNTLLLNPDSGRNYAASLQNLARLPKLSTLTFPYPFDHLLPEELKQVRSLRVLNISSRMNCPPEYSDLSQSQKTDSMNLLFLGSMKWLQEVTLCYHFYHSPVLRKLQPNINWLQLNPDGAEFCFTPETEITLITGQRKKISEIKPGDQLKGYQEESGNIEPTTVNLVYQHPVSHPAMIQVSCKRKNGEQLSVTATPEHPFFVAGKWLKVADLRTGMTLQYCFDETLETVIISGTSIFNSPVESVFNLNTSLHTFFANGLLVHNK